MVMRSGSARALWTIIASVSLIGAAAFAGLAGSISARVDEVLPWMLQMALHAPVDYGPGPGRGRPHTGSRPHARLSPNSTATDAGGSVVSIYLSDKGSYYFMSTC